MSGFDPRSRTGSDGDLGLSTENIARFRSTLPHGERPKRPVGPPICLRFDPRSRTGSDASSVRGVARHRVSIHAPARGATPAPAGDSPAWLFRSTLPHGERASTDRIPGVQRRFDPRSRTGSDAPTSAGRRRWPRFDPRSRSGSDPRFKRGCTVTEFRSTLPHGERPPLQPWLHGDRVSIHAPARGAKRPIHDSRTMIWFRSTLPHGERPRHFFL